MLASLVNKLWLPWDMQDMKLRSIFQHALPDRLSLINIQRCLAIFQISAHGSLLEDHWLICQLWKKRSKGLRNLEKEQQMSLKKKKGKSLSFAQFVVDLSIMSCICPLRPFVVWATKARTNNSQVFLCYYYLLYLFYVAISIYYVYCKYYTFV